MPEVSICSILPLVGIHFDRLNDMGQVPKLLILNPEHGKELSDILINNTPDLDEETIASFKNTKVMINVEPYFGYPKDLSEVVPTTVNGVPILISPQISRHFIVTGKTDSPTLFDIGTIEKAVESLQRRYVSLVVTRLGFLDTPDPIHINRYGVKMIEAPNISNYVIITKFQEDAGWIEEV